MTNTGHAQLKGRGVYLAHSLRISSIMEGKSWWQELEAVVASPLCLWVWSDKCQYSAHILPFILSGPPGQGTALSTVTIGLSASVDFLPVSLHGHFKSHQLTRWLHHPGVSNLATLTPSLFVFKMQSHSIELQACGGVVRSGSCRPSYKEDKMYASTKLTQNIGAFSRCVQLALLCAEREHGKGKHCVLCAHTSVEVWIFCKAIHHTLLLKP